MKEKAISVAMFNAIRYDINWGVFSDTSDWSSKYYRDEENELDIEVESEWVAWRNEWRFDVKIVDDWGEEFILERGQCDKLYDALLADAKYRQEDAESEAKHIAWLWRACV